MKKKIISTLCVALTTFALVGCGNTNKSDELLGNTDVKSVEYYSKLYKKNLSDIKNIYKDNNIKYEFVENVFATDEYKVNTRLKNESNINYQPGDYVNVFYELKFDYDSNVEGILFEGTLSTGTSYVENCDFKFEDTLFYDVAKKFNYDKKSYEELNSEVRASYKEMFKNGQSGIKWAEVFKTITNTYGNITETISLTPNRIDYKIIIK